MCLVALCIGQSERFPFVLASNRDEFFARAAQPLAWWQPEHATLPILSGKDLTGGGTWMGLNSAGRLALVTNVREPGRTLAAAPSRGSLVVQCVVEPEANPVELARVPRNGFNLLCLDVFQVPLAGPDSAVGAWVSNRPTPQHQLIGAGVFGLSNASLDTPWPKVSQLKQRLTAAVGRCQTLDALLAEAFAALLDPQPAADADLPRTGVPLQRERQLSSAFIHIDGGHSTDGGAHGNNDISGAYGTRCSTVVVVEVRAGCRTVHVVERTHGVSGRPGGLRAEHFVLPAQC